MKNNEFIENEAMTFVHDVNEYTRSHPDIEVLNTDQSGINLELHSGRTLEIQGTDKVFSVVQSKNATTHSFTIQTIIKKSGKLIPKMLMTKETVTICCMFLLIFVSIACIIVVAFLRPKQSH